MARIFIDSKKIKKLINIINGDVKNINFSNHEFLNKEYLIALKNNEKLSLLKIKQ